jgi:hypothetical protein
MAHVKYNFNRSISQINSPINNFCIQIIIKPRVLKNFINQFHKQSHNYTYKREILESNLFPVKDSFNSIWKSRLMCS